MAFVLNAREESFRERDRFLTVPRYHEVRLLTVIGARLILYNPRDTHKANFFGVGQIADVLPSPRASRSVDILFDFVQRLPEPILLEEMDALTNSAPLPFHHYSKIIRPISELAYNVVMERISTAPGFMFREMLQSPYQAETHQMRKARIRSARVRNETIFLLGRACLFCGILTTDLTGRLFETEVVHLVPLKNGGPDSVWNTMPACGCCHFRIDHGVMGLDDYGLVLFADKPQEQLHPARRVAMSEAELWPRLEFIRWHRNNIFGQGPTKSVYSIEPQADYEVG